MIPGNLSKSRPSYRPDRIILLLAVGASIPTILLIWYLQHIPVMPAWARLLPTLHIIAECLNIFVSLYIFLLAWHTYPNRRDTFILFLGYVFLIAGLLSLIHVVYYQQHQDPIRGILPAKHDYFFVVGHFFLPLGLILSVFAVDKKVPAGGRCYYLGAAILFFLFIVALGARYYPMPHLSPPRLPDKHAVSYLIDWEILTVPLYTLALFIYHKKKPFVDSKLNALFLSALVLLIYGAVCSSGLFPWGEGVLLGACNPFLHLFEIAAYAIIYWVVFVSSIRYPYKALYRVKESLAESYGELSATLELLRQSEQRYRLLVQNSNDIIYTLDTRNHITFINQNISVLTGYTPTELLNKSFFDLLTPESQKKAAAHTKVLVETGQAQFEDLEILTKDGKGKAIMVNAQPIPDMKGQIIGVQGIARDISERKKKQEQMLHSEKLATVGLISSGIAHEIGTPLNIISGNAEFLLAGLPEHHPMHEELETIVDQCQRISDQVRSLLDFARSSVLRPAPVDINAIISHTLHLLRHMIQSRHTVQLHLSSGLPVLLGDKDHLQQLFINLLLNAFQAMSTGGFLDISTSWESPYITIKLQDTGQGIERKNLRSIFDPFFTTKDPEHGTGLGLAVCTRIIKDHNGLIEVESEVNKGSTFTIRLPLNSHLETKPQEEDIDHG